MKRKIELPSWASILIKKQNLLSMSPIEEFIWNHDYTHGFQAALQEAYNQGYEDARPKWVSVEDSLPDIPEDWYFSKVVTVRWVSESEDYAPQGFESASYSANGWQFADGSMDYHEERTVTHWMLIPDVPENV